MGSNIAGTDVIVGTEYIREGEMERFMRRLDEQYSRTPVFDAERIPRGKHMHIGDGVWLRRCRECDDYIKTYGAIDYIREFAEHEADHGLIVPGYNQALLP